MSARTKKKPQELQRKTKKQTQEPRKGLRTCTFPRDTRRAGDPESHVFPPASEQDVMFLGAIMPSWDMLCSSCSRVPGKDSLVVHRVISHVFVLPRLMEVASSPCWFAACFHALARLWPRCFGFRRHLAVPASFLLRCSVQSGWVCFVIDTGQEHERTIMNMSWTKPWQTRGCPISDDVSHAVGKKQNQRSFGDTCRTLRQDESKKCHSERGSAYRRKENPFCSTPFFCEDHFTGVGKRGLFYHLFCT